MLYHVYDLHRTAMAGASVAAAGVSQWLLHPLNPFAYTETGDTVAHALDVFAHSTRHYDKPTFGFDSTVIDGRPVAIHEEVVVHKPFGDLLHFKRATPRNDPKLLIVAPMSGHYATLLRGTVEQMLPDHDVYITDWRDAKLVPTYAGRFALDDYIDYLVEFLEYLGPGAHMLAVCQPSVPAFATVSLLASIDHPCQPASLTMMGGPIDTRENPTKVNTLAMQRPLAWFEHNVIATVPAYYPGSYRKVYPGFLQLAGFMSMNLGNHMMSHWNMYKHLVQGDGESAESTKAFYEEYRAVCDMAAEFYIQTVDVVFQRHLLPKGEFEHKGVIMDPHNITRTALLCIEGERDDISGLGQTKSALKLATALDQDKKQYLMAKGVGHYGIFNGRKWREMIAPEVKHFIRANSAAAPRRSLSLVR
jgi:poly(3-hydroxybutyrate) depolymerase